jgi:aspartate carbamoyltransferase catalytic subunit
VRVDEWGTNLSYDFDRNLSSFDAVMMLRVQRERMSDSFFPSEREYSRSYGLNAQRISTMKEGAIVMHPGPMNRGLEISADAADSSRSVISDQVKNGVSVRMAVLYLLLSGEAV